jgi:hypothetical protein
MTNYRYIPAADQISSTGSSSRHPDPRGPVPALSPPQGRSPTHPSTSAVAAGKPTSRSLRPFRAGASEDIGSAIQTLRDARQKLRGAGAKRAGAAVARALKSAEGALRHADRIRGVAERAS